MTDVDAVYEAPAVAQEAPGRLEHGPFLAWPYDSREFCRSELSSFDDCMCDVHDYANDDDGDAVMEQFAASADRGFSTVVPIEKAVVAARKMASVGRGSIESPVSMAQLRVAHRSYFNVPIIAKLIVVMSFLVYRPGEYTFYGMVYFTDTPVQVQALPNLLPTAPGPLALEDMFLEPDKVHWTGVRARPTAGTTVDIDHVQREMEILRRRLQSLVDLLHMTSPLAGRVVFTEPPWSRSYNYGVHPVIHKIFLIVRDTIEVALENMAMRILERRPVHVSWG